MKLDNLKIIYCNLKNEYNENLIKINTYNENIKKLHPNLLSNKLIKAFATFSISSVIINYALTSLCLLLNINVSNIIPIITSLILTIITISLNTKISKDMSSKKQKELYNNYYKYKLKKEYLINKNRILFKNLSEINNDIEKFELLSEKYDFSIIKNKNEDNSPEEIIKLNEKLKKEYNNVKTNTTKCFLKNNLFKSKKQKIAKTITTFLLGFLLMFLLCNFTTLKLHNFLGKSNIFFKILIPGLTGGISFSLTNKKIQNNKNRIFNDINRKLENEKLNINKIKLDTSFLDLESSISNASELRNRFEKLKIRYSELIKKQNNKKEENKYDYTNGLERLVDGIPNEPENMLTINEMNSEFFNNKDIQSKPKGLTLVNTEYNKF